MAGSLLLDTNVVTALFNSEPEVLARFRSSVNICVPVFVLGELYYGALFSTRVDENLARINEFESAVIVVGADLSTCRVYGRLKADLRRRGTMIPENDLWIATVAIQHSATLVSRDQHFQHVEGLTIERW